MDKRAEWKVLGLSSAVRLLRELKKSRSCRRVVLGWWVAFVKPDAVLVVELKAGHRWCVFVLRKKYEF